MSAKPKSLTIERMKARKAKYFITVQNPLLG